MAKRIFIVDDDEGMCTLLSMHFEENSNHEIHVFTSGEKCINNLHLEPDVVILDYMLNADREEYSNGLDILSRIKEFDQSVHVIILSAQEHYGKAAQTISKGAIEYVMKNKEAFKRIDRIMASI